MKLLTSAPAGSPEWHAARKGKIGGTAAANILCGNDPEERTFGSPLTEWLRLTGRSQETEEDNEILRWGRESEELHRRLLEIETGGVSAPGGGVYQDDAIPWIAVCPDGHIDIDIVRYRLELKAPMPWSRPKSKLRNGAPRPYRVQAALQAYVMNDDAAIVSVLIPPAPHWHAFDRDRSFEQQVLDVLGHFMDYHVARDIPPDASGMRDELRRVLRSHPKETGKSVDLPDDLREAFEEHERWKRAQDEAETNVERLKTKIALAIAPNSEGVCGPFRATYQWQSRRSYTTRDTEYPVLRVTRS